MVAVRVNFYATLRPVVGGKTVELPFTGEGSVQSLLEALLARYPALRPHLFDAGGVLYPHVHVFINGREARYLEAGLGTALTDADTVNIFPPVGGGCD